MKAKRTPMKVLYILKFVVPLLAFRGEGSCSQTNVVFFSRYGTVILQTICMLMVVLAVPMSELLLPVVPPSCGSSDAPLELGRLVSVHLLVPMLRIGVRHRVSLLSGSLPCGRAHGPSQLTDLL